MDKKSSFDKFIKINNNFVKYATIIVFICFYISDLKYISYLTDYNGIFLNLCKADCLLKFIYVPFKIMFALVFAIYGVFIVSKVCKTVDLKTNLIYLSVFAFLLIANGFLEIYTIKYSNQQHNMYLYQILKNYTNDKIRYDEKSTLSGIIGHRKTLSDILIVANCDI